MRIGIVTRLGVGLLLAALSGGCTKIAGVDEEYQLFPNACHPRDGRSCYTGPAGTEGVGVCKAGTETCNAHGIWSGVCVGEVTPPTPGGGCTCVPGESLPCYSGPASTEGIGYCHGGTHVCNAEGNGFGVCVGEKLPTVELCRTGVNESCDGEAVCMGGYLWSKRIGDELNTYGYSVATDQEDNIVLAGQYAGTVDFGSPPLPSTSGGIPGIYVAKLDEAGANIWSKYVGIADVGQVINGTHVMTDSMKNIVLFLPCGSAVDFGGGALTGSNDVCIAKLNGDGAYVWGKRFDGPSLSNFLGASVAVDASDNIAIVGSFGGTVNVGCPSNVSKGSYDVLVSKLNSEGKCIWSKSFGDMVDQLGYDVAADSERNLVIAGSYRGTIAPCSTPLTSSGGYDIFVVKFDENGNCLWSKSFGSAGSTDDQSANAIAVDSNNNIVITGSFVGSADFGVGAALLGNGGASTIFAAKLDSGGNPMWRNGFGAGPFGNTRVAIDRADEIVLTGEYGAAASGSGVIYVTKLSPSGISLWTKLVGGALYQSSTGVAVDSASNIILTGFYNTSVDFGGGALADAGDNIFVAKLTR